MAHISWTSGAGFVPALTFVALAANSLEHATHNTQLQANTHVITDLAATVIYGVLATLYAAATWEGAYLISAATLTPYAIGALLLLSAVRAYVSCGCQYQKQIKQFSFAGLLIAIPTLYILSEM